MYVVWPHVVIELTRRLDSLRHKLETVDATNATLIAATQAQIRLCRELLRLPEEIARTLAPQGGPSV